MCNQVKKRKRIINIAIWNVDNKDIGFSIDSKEDIALFLITCLKQFAVDILILFNSSISFSGSWNGYNIFRTNNVIILWTQCIIISPVWIEEENVIWIDELRFIINLGFFGISKISVFVYDILLKKKPRNTLICVGNFNSFNSKYVKAKVNIIDGLDSVFFIGKTINRMNIINTPFNMNKLAIINIFREIQCTLGPRLMKIKSIDTIKDVKRILNNEEPKSFPTIKKSVRFNAIRGTFGTLSYLVNKLINNQMRPIFEKWNGIWIGSRKEPYLGNSIPESVKFSYQVLLGDDNWKKYVTIDIPKKIPMGTYSKDITKNAFYYGRNALKRTERLKLLKGLVKNVKTSSVAANFDLYQIKDIVQGVKEWIEEKGNLAVDGNVKAQRELSFLLRNVINKLNKFEERQVMLSFFLLKNPKLQSASDTRMIVITPTLLKIFEVIIYNEVVNGCNEIMDRNVNKWKYQYGARLDCSTTRAMVELRDKMLEVKADGILMLDISKGYESVNLKLLFQAIKEFTGEENRLRYLLLSWVSFVNNLDVLVSGTLIRKTIGIPMGLMLSPIMFIIYVEYLLKGFNNKEDLIMYIDDIALLLFNDGRRDSKYGKVINNIKTINDYLKKGNLLINLTKAKLLTDSDILINIVKKEFPKIEHGSVIRYLGREITIKGDLLLPIDIDVNKGFNQLISQVPKWAPLIIRMSVLNGGLEARNAFQAMMWEISKDLRTKLFYRAKRFYASSFNNLQDIQLLFVIRNYFRMGLGALTVRSWIKFPTSDKEIIRKRLDVIEEALKLGSVELDIFGFMKFDKWFSYEDFRSNIDIDYFICWKKFTKHIWNKYKLNILKEYALGRVLLSWDFFYCTLVGVEKDGSIHYVSLIRRFSFALDMIFGQALDGRNVWELNIDFILRLLSLQIDTAIDNLLEDKKFEKFVMEPLIVEGREGLTTMRREFFMKVAFINIICKDGYKNVTRDALWKSAINFAGDSCINLWEAFEVELGNRRRVGVSINNIAKRNKTLAKNLGIIREEIISWLIMLDSIYKDGNIEFFSFEKSLSYLNIMKDLFKDEINEQKKVLNILDWKMDDDDSFSIDQNIEYNDEV